MKRFLGILLMTFANLILLAHSIIPHNSCKENHQHSEVACQHDHTHSHDLDTQEDDFDLNHLFCHIAHGESDFVYQNEISNEVSLNPIVLISLFQVLFNYASHEESVAKRLIVTKEIPIYYSPHLIRSGQKAPPFA